jgi:hypothetical protein
MSAKLFKCTPDQLPADLKANLLAMLRCGVNALEGYIRPGCLHLTLQAMVRHPHQGCHFCSRNQSLRDYPGGCLHPVLQDLVRMHGPIEALCICSSS